MDSPLKTGPDASPASTSPTGAIDPSDRYAGAKNWSRTRPGLEISGVNGRIVWMRTSGDPTTSGYRAAAVHGYVVNHDKRQREQWRLRAVVAAVDTFNLRQRPLYFVAPYVSQKGKPGSWTWRLLDLDLQGTTITAIAVFESPQRSRK